MQSAGHFQRLQNDTAFNIVRLLKACRDKKDLAEGSRLLAYAQEHKFLKSNSYIASSLVDMYAKCGALVKAKQLLQELPAPGVATWNALIAGYVKHGQGEEALKCHDNMQWEGHCPDEVTFVSALKACGSTKAAAKGIQIHYKMFNLGMLEKDIVLGSTLVNMYAKCGALARAQQVLEELPNRNVVAWNSLITGYAQEKQGEKSLRCFDIMQYEGHSPNAITFSSALIACGVIGAAAKGEQIYEKIANLGILEKDVVLGSTLLDMYVKCGLFTKAEQVLQELPIRDVSTWNTVISGYTQQGLGQKALKCFDGMQREGHSPDVITFNCVLKACGIIGATTKGERIHDKIVSLGVLEKNIVLGNTLVDMYARCGALDKAQKVLEELAGRSAITWNALITGYVQQGQGDEALKCFDSMKREGHSPDAATFTCVLKACGIIGSAIQGEKIHDEMTSLGLLERNLLLGSTLVDMYAKCGALAKAAHVLEGLSIRDVVTWNALITGYTRQEQGEEVLKCYDDMQHDGHTPDAITFMCVLKACGSIGAVTKGEEIHEKIANLGLLKEDILLGSTLVEMYAKCGALAKGQEVLEELPVRDMVMWNALIAEYAQQGQGEEALKCFDSMQHEGHSPDVITFICALKACGSIGASAKGKEIHDLIVSLGMLEKNIVLGNSLVDMYAKCAALTKALEVLEELPVDNVVAWNALIGGYAQQGQSAEALACFEKMQLKGMKPDSPTLVCVFSACSHSGLWDQAGMIFSRMNIKCGFTPDMEHYACMINLFSRAGKFREALAMIEMMPTAEYVPVWAALLGACRNWEEVKIGRFAFDHALGLDKCLDAAYLSMASIYTVAGMQEDANKIDVMRVVNSAWEAD